MKTKLFTILISLLISSTSYSQAYKEKELRVIFPNGIANQAVDILFGNNSLSGSIEISVVGTYANENSVGTIKKKFQIGLNSSNGVWYTPTSRIIEAEGPILDNVYVGDIVWDSSLNQYKLTIYHTKSTGNPYGFHLTQHNNEDAVIDQASLSSVYTNILQGQKKHSVHYNNMVGIGIKDPKHMLDVNGTIHSKEVKIDMDGWADYVFKKEYNLPTLQEVEKHIQEKGHLPNIPSEKEVIEKGISLGEAQKLLLQKIEELTLYIIEHNKENKAQSEKIEELTQEINQLKQK